MILKEKVESLLAKANERYPEHKDKVYKLLLDRGVKESSEFMYFCCKWFIGALPVYKISEVADADLTDGFSLECDVAHQYWEIPQNYILFSTGEGEGGYLYNIEDEKVYDFKLGQQDALLRGELPHWDSFCEFMIWYLTPDDE